MASNQKIQFLGQIPRELAEDGKVFYLYLVGGRYKYGRIEYAKLVINPKGQREVGNNPLNGGTIYRTKVCIEWDSMIRKTCVTADEILPSLIERQIAANVKLE